MSWRYPPVMAHRCGGALTPENTLIGLEMAARLGCRGVEFDVMLSADEEPFVIHDETLERTTNGLGAVSASSAAALRSLDAGCKHHRAFAGELLPAFSEVICRCRTLGLVANVEIKPATGFEALTGRVVARAAQEGWRGSTIAPLLSSFSEEALEAAAEVAPELPRGWLIDTVPDDWRERCQRLGVVALHTNTAHLKAELAACIRAEGLHLVVYTENDPHRAAELRRWGVDTVITDRPDLF